MLQIGVDFGGTKIEAAALGADGAFLSRHRRPNPGNYDEAIAVVRDLVRTVEAEAVMHGSVDKGTIGIGTPGSISPKTGLMRNSNSIYLNGRPFREDLEAALGRAVRMANDANCLALSEATDGAAAGLETVFAVIVGTGCGGGVVAGKKLINGVNGVAGEWGHIPLPWPKPEEYPGPTCWCGQKSCLETWVSGSGFARDFLEVTGKAWKGEEIITAMRGGNPEAEAAFDRLCDRLGRAMAVVVNLLDPDAFVLGGGLSNVPEIYDRLPGKIQPYIFSDILLTRIVQAKWGDSSGVRGAARLWT